MKGEKMNNEKLKGLLFWLKWNTYKDEGESRAESGLEALKIIAGEFEKEAAIDQLGEERAFDQWARGLPSCNAFEFLNFQGPNGDKYPARHALEEIEGQSLYNLEEDEAETILIGLIFQAVSQYRREGERMGALIEKRTAEA